MRKLKKLNYETEKVKWYKKLKDSGFEDIENGKGGLKRYDSYRRQEASEATWQAKATYYQMAENFLEAYKFETVMEKAIWEYHSNGMSVRDIASVLKKISNKKFNKDSVLKIIKRLTSSMYAMYVQPVEEYHE